MNLMSCLVIYAAICRELGVPLDFPGTPENYRAVYQCTDTEHLARAIAWIGTAPDAADQAFNVTNGDFIRWANVWPLIAETMGLPRGRVRTLTLADWMADKEPLWDAMVARHDLRPHKLAELADFRHADFVFHPHWDIMSSTTKLRQAGFHDVVDTEAMLIRLIQAYRADRLIP